MGSNNTKIYKKNKANKAYAPAKLIFFLKNKDQIEVYGKKFDIVELPKPDAPYIILEILSRDKNQCRGVHIINMGLKNYIKLVILQVKK